MTLLLNAQTTFKGDKMSNLLVSEADVEEAMNWLARNDEPMAQAHADVEKYDELKKVTIAELMNLSGKSSAKSQEAEALASQEYRQFLEERAAVTKKYIQLKLRASYLNTRIDVWRTVQANIRRTV